MVGSGVFSADPGFQILSLEAMLHGVISVVALSSAAIAPFFMWRRLGKDDLWRKHRIHALVTGIALIMILFLGFPQSLTTASYIERLMDFEVAECQTGIRVRKGD